MQAVKNPSTPTTERSLLSRAILANAVFTGVSAVVLLLFSGPLTSFMNLPGTRFLVATGVILAAYAPFLVWTARKSPVPKLLAWLVIDLDLLWILGSTILIFTDIGGISTGGKWALAFVADVVAIFAVAQFLGLRKRTSEQLPN